MASQQRGGDLRDDLLRGGARIGGLRHRPADDEIVGAVGDRLRRRRDALLVADGGAGRANARRDEKQRIADRGAQHRGLRRAGDEAVDARAPAPARRGAPPAP